MRCIDFDDRFARYVRAWLNEHEDEYGDADQLEDQMPVLYDSFLDAPADWLEGRKPGEYFEQWDDAQLLVDWVEAYIDQGVSLPDMLLNRVAALGERAEAPLMRLIEDDGVSGEEKMLAISLLREIGSLAPLKQYVQWQRGRGDEDELCDNALESLEGMGEAAVPEMLEALEGATPAGQEALLSVLSRGCRDEQVLSRLLALFDRRPERRAILAAYLGRLGDPRALPRLSEAALEERLKYLDYIEIRSAIEALGGEAPAREFYDDPEYEALFGLADR